MDCEECYYYRIVTTVRGKEFKCTCCVKCPNGKDKYEEEEDEE